MKPAVRHCAIYARKSSEDGLEQDFNSLDAQREACQAYVSSQKSEGWSVVKKQYEDGGFSGGNMERPALKELMDDIKAGKVHIVVVYKIDRLTRSLMDFSKLVEVFDQYGVTFVSVTQAFNTTTSMGRLTLNVLLSFAQFEREVTGERIRDKVAASKKKGMWMGGCPPFGYDIKDKQLVVNEEDVPVLRLIFERYLELGCVARLKTDLESKSIKSRLRISEKGFKSGGENFSRGALYHLLKNPILVGKIRHKGNIYDGLHPAIIPEPMWERVQEQLISQARRTRNMRKQTSIGSLLKGKLFDEKGIPYSPCYTSRGSIKYCYYINQALLQYRHQPKGVLARVPANEIERAVESAIREQLPDILKFDAVRDRKNIQIIKADNSAIPCADLIKAICKIIISEESLAIHIETATLKIHAEKYLEVSVRGECPDVTINVPFEARRSRDGAVILEAQKRPGEKDPFDLPQHELKNLIRGIVWRQQHFEGMTFLEIATRENCSQTLVGNLIHQSLELA